MAAAVARRSLRVCMVDGPGEQVCREVSETLVAEPQIPLAGRLERARYHGASVLGNDSTGRRRFARRGVRGKTQEQGRKLTR